MNSIVKIGKGKIHLFYESMKKYTVKQGKPSLLSVFNGR